MNQIISSGLKMQIMGNILVHFPITLRYLFANQWPEIFCQFDFIVRHLQASQNLLLLLAFIRYKIRDYQFKKKISQPISKNKQGFLFQELKKTNLASFFEVFMLQLSYFSLYPYLFIKLNTVIGIH